MPFTKETAKVLGSKGAKARDDNRASWWDFMASGGLRKYNDLMDILAVGKAINKWQEQFMDRSEKSFPFIKARKTEVTGADGKDLFPQPIANVCRDNSIQESVTDEKKA